MISLDKVGLYGEARSRTDRLLYLAANIHITVNHFMLTLTLRYQFVILTITLTFKDLRTQNLKIVKDIIYPNNKISLSFTYVQINRVLLLRR